MPILSKIKRLRSANALSDTSGAAAVEFAIVGSIFILVALGILAYGLYFGAAHSVSQLAADAARASVAGLTDSERAKLATNHVSQNAGSYMLLRSEKVSVTAAAADSDVNQFNVVVSYEASNLPIWFMAKMLPLPDKTISRSASIMRGGY